MLQDLSDIVVDILDHREQRKSLGSAISIRDSLGDFRVRLPGFVGGRSGNETEEGLLFVLIDELRGLAEENIGRKALGFDLLPILPVGRIEVVVPKVILQLTDATSPVNEGLLKPTETRGIRIRHAEMPLAKNSGGVAGFPQKIRKGFLVFVKNGDSAHRVVNSQSKGVAARQKEPPAGRTIGRGVEVGEVDAFFREGINVGRLDQFMAMATELVVALVVSQDQEDIGGRRQRNGTKQRDQGETNFAERFRLRGRATIKLHGWIIMIQGTMTNSFSRGI